MTDTSPAASEEAWPEEDLERVPNCPVCGEEKRETLYDGLTDRVFRCAPGEWTLQKCLTCEAAYLDPRPTEASISRAYASYYTHVPPYPTWTGWRGQSRIRQMLFHGYLNARYGYHLQPSLFLGRLLLPFLPKQQAHLDWFEARFLSLPPGGGRLLDIGCGNGQFLMQMREKGWETYGLEIDPEAVAVAQTAGLDVREGMLESDTFPKEFFDAITMSHVTEHLHRPIETLERCCHILKPGGVLNQVTPNLESKGHQKFGRDWVNLDPPRHLILFTADSLERACRSAGLEIVALSAPQKEEFSTRASLAVIQGRDAFQDQPWPDAAQRSEIDALNASARRRPREAAEIIVMARRPLAAH